MPRENGKALEWLQKAADGGVAEAQHRLGKIYMLGVIVPKDEITAFVWVSLAAVQGHAEAQETAMTFSYMLGPGKIAEARHMADQWLSAHPQAARPDYDLWLIPLEQP